MTNGADDNRPQATESPTERRARELREKAARAAEAPDIEPGELQPPIVIRDYGQLMDGGSVRIMLQDTNGQKACLEWNQSINGKFRGQVLEYRPGGKTWAPVGNDVLHRVQTWIGEAVLKGDFPPEYADDVADFAKYAK
jgi:hypothetical protein